MPKPSPFSHFTDSINIVYFIISLYKVALYYCESLVGGLAETLSNKHQYNT